MASEKEFKPGEMRIKYGTGDSYLSPVSKSGSWPSARFYWKIAKGPFRWLCNLAARGQCDDAAWTYGSAWCADILEEVGGSLDIKGMANIDPASGPYVFIANHMSTLETFFLPAIIRPRLPLTFVVKHSLVTMPFFGPVMRSRNPVVVNRVNPREDLEAVLEGGVERLRAGISIVVFPQSTRALFFEPERFNSIGIKLARKAGVPVIPLALKTDAWGKGALISELGKIRPDLPARFLFEKPVHVEGNGKKEHAEITRFIGGTLAAWQARDGVNQ